MKDGLKQFRIQFRQRHFNKSYTDDAVTASDMRTRQKGQRLAYAAGWALQLLLAMVFSLIITRLSLDFSDLPFQLVHQLLLTLAVHCVLFIIFWSWKSLLVFLGLLAAGGGLAWLSGRINAERLTGTITEIIFWLTEAFYWLIAQPNRFSENTSPALSLVIGGLIAAASALLVARTIHPWIMLTTITALFLIREFLQMDYLLLPGLLAIALSVLAFAFRQKRMPARTHKRKRPDQIFVFLPAMIPIICAALLAGLLTTMIPTVYFTQLRRYTPDNVLPADLTITAAPSSDGFSLSSAGYYSTQNQLGGPVRIDESVLLTFTGAADAFLLKGSVSDIYDGHRWFRMPMLSDYRLNDPLWRDLQRHVFELDVNAYPENNQDGTNGGTATETTDAEVFNKGFKQTDVQYEIIHRKAGMRTVFASGSPASITVYHALPAFEFQDGQIEQTESFLISNAALYFNQGGAVYQLRDLLSSQRYQFTGKRLDINQADFQLWYASVLEQNSRDWTNPEEAERLPVPDRAFLQLPDRTEYQIGGELDQLVQGIITEKAGSFDKAIALRDYLRDNNRYSLDVEIPPLDQEFVSWFLQEGEGYCVYYATALTMLCRLAGIPARYVEGFYVPPDAADSTQARTTRHLTGYQAHAWTEVHLENFGWIPLDATPGGGEAAETVQQSPVGLPQDPAETTPVISPTETTPTDREQKPTPTSTRSTQTINQNDGNMEFSSRGIVRYLLNTAGMILFVILAFWILSRCKTQKEKATEIWWLSRFKDPDIRFHQLFEEMCLLLKRQGLVWFNTWTWSQFARTVSQQLDCSPEWEEMAQTVQDVLYGRTRADESEWHKLWRCYPAVYAQYLNRRPVWQKPLRMLRAALFSRH